MRTIDVGNTAEQINTDVNTVVKALVTDGAKPPIEAIGRLLGTYLMDIHATRVQLTRLVDIQEEILRIKRME